jgi:hypothetical protein
MRDFNGEGMRMKYGCIRTDWQPMFNFPEDAKLIDDKQYQLFRQTELTWFYNYLFNYLTTQVHGDNDLFKSTIDTIYDNIVNAEKPIEHEYLYVVAATEELKDMFNLPFDEAIIYIKKFYAEICDTLKDTTFNEGKILIEKLMENGKL